MGLEGEFSENGLIAAELELTLSIAEEANPDARFSRDELVAYHSLQYGEVPVSTLIALNLIDSKEHPGWFKPEGLLEKTSELPDRIERMTSKEGLKEDANNVSAPLGRIAIGYDAELPDKLKNFTGVLSFPSGPNGRRAGRFLYPFGDVSLGYAGRHEQTEELKEFLVRRGKVDPLAHSLEFDDIAATREDGETQRFVAVSTSLGLKKIVQGPSS